MQTCFDSSTGSLTVNSATMLRHFGGLSDHGLTNRTSINSATMNSVTPLLLLICIIILAIVAIRHRLGKKKYEHPDYLQHLETD